MKRLTNASLALVALILGATPALAQMPPPQKPKVEVVLAEDMLIAPSIEVPGTVVSRNDAEIASEIAGRVAWVADEGAILEANDVIARLDQTRLKLDLAEAEANVKRLKADAAYQAREASRLSELEANGNIPKSRLDEVRSRRDMTTQALAVAEIQRDRIAYNLEHSEVRAPFPGRVVARLVQVGEFTTVGRPVARFVDTTNIEVRAQVPVSVAPWISADQAVEINHNGSPSAHTIRTVIPVGDQQSRTFEIRVRAEDTNWIVGSPVRLSVPSGEAETVVAAPRDTLVIRATGVMVYRIDDDNKAERLQVTTGSGKGNFIALKGPVKAGDRLVIRGGEFLRPGQEVEILEASS